VLGEAVEPFEVVRREEEAVAPVESEPAHVGLDRIDVLFLFLRRVRVVHPQVAGAAEFAGDAEVEADRLGVPDVQVAVGLRREACHHALVLPGLEVRRHDVADEILPRLAGCGLGAGRLIGAWRCRAWHGCHLE
jgi:hypothetical protein